MGDVPELLAGFQHFFGWSPLHKASPLRKALAVDQADNVKTGLTGGGLDRLVANPSGTFRSGYRLKTRMINDTRCVFLIHWPNVDTHAPLP